MKDSIAGILAEIYNKSLENEQNIEQIYEANILPVFKKGLKSVALNYRPIARTSVVSKNSRKNLGTHNSRSPEH